MVLRIRLRYLERDTSIFIVPDSYEITIGRSNELYPIMLGNHLPTFA